MKTQEHSIKFFYIKTCALYLLDVRYLSVFSKGERVLFSSHFPRKRDSGKILCDASLTHHYVIIPSTETQSCFA